MKFIDFLEIADYEGEVYVKDKWESEFTFVWDKSFFKFTKKGKEKFKSILNSEIKYFRGNIELQNPLITEKEYNYFMRTIAGYISDREFKTLLIETTK
jgi:hypothetical protein